MKNEALLKKANIVVLANTYNPSIISPNWVQTKGLFSEPPSNFLHTPAISVVENNNFALTVDVNRLQLIAKVINKENIKTMPGIITSFLNLLPETPYTAMGFNFIYDLRQQKDDFLKGFISHNSTNIKRVFSPKYELGIIVSFNFENFQVRVSISPSESKEKIRTFDFNFHTVIKDVRIAIKDLKLYEKILKTTERIITRG